MKRMTMKRAALLLLAFTLAVSLFGCESEIETTPTDTTDTTETTEIVTLPPEIAGSEDFVCFVSFIQMDDEGHESYDTIVRGDEAKELYRIVTGASVLWPYIDLSKATFKLSFRSDDTKKPTKYYGEYWIYSDDCGRMQKDPSAVFSTYLEYALGSFEQIREMLES